MEIWRWLYLQLLVTDNVIDFVTIATTGNATDFGDLNTSKKLPLVVVQMSHGGYRNESMIEHPSLETATSGSIRFNTDSSKLEIYNGECSGGR